MLLTGRQVEAALKLNVRTRFLSSFPFLTSQFQIYFGLRIGLSVFRGISKQENMQIKINMTHTNDLKCCVLFKLKTESCKIEPGQKAAASSAAKT